ncbi:unnamed protein product, partial [Brassica rapa]
LRISRLISNLGNPFRYCSSDVSLSKLVVFLFCFLTRLKSIQLLGYVLS